MNDLTFLIGFMGAGKTTLGRDAADRTGYTFLDLDDLIEKREEKSIREIFEEKGEAYFRQIERAMLQSLIFLPPAYYLVATGGGTPCFEDNMEWMKMHGKVIYLNPSIATLAERLFHEIAKRPLLHGLGEADIQDFISTLLQKRARYYEQAHHQLSDKDITTEKLLSLIQKPFNP